MLFRSIIIFVKNRLKFISKAAIRSFMIAFRVSKFSSSIVAMAMYKSMNIKVIFAISLNIVQPSSIAVISSTTLPIFTTVISKTRLRKAPESQKIHEAREISMFAIPFNKSSANPRAVFFAKFPTAEEIGRAHV